jgi:hypothetical protein
MALVGMKPSRMLLYHSSLSCLSSIICYFIARFVTVHAQLNQSTTDDAFVRGMLEFITTRPLLATAHMAMVNNWITIENKKSFWRHIDHNFVGYPLRHRVCMITGVKTPQLKKNFLLAYSCRNIPHSHRQKREINFLNRKCISRLKLYKLCLPFVVLPFVVLRWVPLRISKERIQRVSNPAFRWLKPQFNSAAARSLVELCCNSQKTWRELSHQQHHSDSC